MIKTFSEWGIAGARKYDGCVGAIIVVDVLSFSTCVDIAVARGASVFPFASGDRDAAAGMAEARSAEVAGPRGSTKHRYSLSPASLAAIASQTKLMLPSPNGSSICAAACVVPVLAGCLRNAAAVAARAAELSQGGAIAVIPAGERWPDGGLRPAIEDLIGAGAILDELDVACSPEAEIARQVFHNSRSKLAELIRGSVSGQELISRGYPDDVEFAIEHNVSDAAPLLVDGAFTR
jgi:2-phosphosulfolactate phosphatase